MRSVEGPSVPGAMMTPDGTYAEFASVELRDVEIKDGESDYGNVESDAKGADDCVAHSSVEART